MSYKNKIHAFEIEFHIIKCNKLPICSIYKYRKVENYKLRPTEILSCAPNKEK